MELNLGMFRDTKLKISAMIRIGRHGRINISVHGTMYSFKISF